MKAIRYHEYGSPGVLRHEEVGTPAPGDGEVLVAVRAAAVNPLDRHVIRGMPYPIRLAFGLRRPKEPRLGVDVAGRVEAVGRNVTRFRAGDEVFGASRGAFAEYAVTRDSALAMKPRNVTFEQAAAAPVGALTALHALRDNGRVQPGQTVLINGAAGGVGTFAVQIARALGAEVTAVCSTRNLDLVRGIGAQQAIDYTREDFTRGSRRYDVLFDCIGNHSLSACRRILNRGGAYLAIGAPTGRWIAPLPRLLAVLVLSPFVSQRLVVSGSKANHEDLAVIAGMMESGQVTSVIDRCYPLAEAAAAVRYLEAGHARGKVVITV